MATDKNSMDLGRREFLGKALGGALTLAVAPTVLACACSNAFASDNKPFAFDPITVDLDLGTNAVLRSVGGSKYFGIPGNTRGIILTKATDTEYVALTSVCTHEQNRVNLYSKTAQRYSCEATDHGPSRFDLYGNVIQGPAELPLTRYKTTYDGVSIVVIEDSVLSAQPVKTGTFDLAQNYPNPFSGETTIAYSLTAASAVELVISEITGKEVYHEWLGILGVGAHTFRFDGSRLPTGTYLYELRTETAGLVKQMQILR